MGIFFLVLQCLFLLVLLFGDIGFDLRGRYGLSFNHFILFCSLYGVALIAGLSCTIADKSWKMTGVQILIPVFILIAISLPPPEYNAADYQHLISKQRTEVERELGRRGEVVTGIVTFRGMSCEFVTYNGMQIYYSPEDDTVLAVEASDTWGSDR